MKRWLCVTSLAFALVSSKSFAADKASPAATRAIMNDIFGAVKVVLPLASDDAAFKSAENDAKLRASLATLATNAGRLEAHTKRMSFGVEFLGWSLANDAKLTNELFRADRKDDARFFATHLIDYCVACHSRVPSDRAFPAGQSLTKDPMVARLNPEERLRIQIASRQFDSALASYEQIFAQVDPSRDGLALEQTVVDYLTLALRVKDDPKRPAAALERLRSRLSKESALADNINQWLVELHKLKRRVAPDKRLVEARRLIKRSERQAIDVLDRHGLVYDVYASALLHRFINDNPNTGAAIGEAYYLLALVEMKINRSFWVSPEGFFLETAIRLAPGAPYSLDALSLLEDYLILQYAGSSGLHLPDDVSERYLELRELVLKNHRADEVPASLFQRDEAQVP